MEIIENVGGVVHVTIAVGAEPDMPYTMWQACKALKGAAGYLYIGSPYSRHPEGLCLADYEAKLVTGALIAAGIPAFSPIAHSHGIAEMSGIDPFSYDVWIPADHPLMDAASGLVVVMMSGWETSKGLAIEIAEFENAGKRVVYVDPNVDGWLQAERARPKPVVDYMAGHKASAA